MDLGLAGKTALVTGGSLGIGRAIAAELAAHQVKVAITARDGARLARSAEELSQATQGRVFGFPCDMADPDQIGRSLAAVRDALGPIDILVNNAGASPAGRIADLTDEIWYKSFELKIMGYVRCARALLPEMRARKWGRIINITGRGGDVPTAGYLLGAFNAALHHFTRALAQDVAADNVLVNAVSPGATNTPRLRNIFEQRAAMIGRPRAAVEQEWVAAIPVGRAAEPEDIAGIVAFLCSDRARHIAGAIVNVDGGGAHGV